MTPGARPSAARVLPPGVGGKRPRSARGPGGVPGEATLQHGVDETHKRRRIARVGPSAGVPGPTTKAGEVCNRVTRGARGVFRSCICSTGERPRIAVYLVSTKWNPLSEEFLDPSCHKGNIYINGTTRGLWIAANLGTTSYTEPLAHQPPIYLPTALHLSRISTLSRARPPPPRPLPPAPPQPLRRPLPPPPPILYPPRRRTGGGSKSSGWRAGGAGGASLAPWLPPLAPTSSVGATGAMLAGANDISKTGPPDAPS